MTTHNFKVNGAHCNSCKMLIEEELEDNNATDINVQLNTETQTATVSCESELPFENIKTFIEELGEYQVEQ